MLRVEIGAIAPRPPFWVVYTANPPTPTPALATWPRHTTLRPPCWTIPEADLFQMHAFTRPSQQLRQKSQGCDPSKHAPYLHLHETHRTSKKPRSNHSYHRDGTPRPPPRELKRTHEPPQIHPRASIQCQTYQKIRTRPDERVPLIPPPGFMHTHCRRM